MKQKTFERGKEERSRPEASLAGVILRVQEELCSRPLNVSDLWEEFGLPSSPKKGVFDRKEPPNYSLPAEVSLVPLYPDAAGGVSGSSTYATFCVGLRREAEDVKAGSVTKFWQWADLPETDSNKRRVITSDDVTAYAKYHLFDRASQRVLAVHPLQMTYFTGDTTPVKDELDRLLNEFEAGKPPGWSSKAHELRWRRSLLEGGRASVFRHKDRVLVLGALALRIAGMSGSESLLIPYGTQVARAHTGGDGSLENQRRYDDVIDLLSRGKHNIKINHFYADYSLIGMYY